MRAAANWCGLAALGSGLILCAVAAGASPFAAVPLLAFAAAELLWGIAALRMGRAPAPRTALVVAAGAVALLTALLFAGDAAALPLLALAAMQWSAALLVARDLRRARDLRSGAADTPVAGDGAVPAADPRVGSAREPAGGPRREPVRGPGRVVLVLAVQGMLIAAITTPALAHTAPGASALPHGVSHAH
ncbi:hypothetical protein MUN77_09360 [Leucobacter allii]|uniref:hypothetical protein n=1 Tax=Leucobacter allii TaxID=2932247 RepID=UPI001FD2457D|nr:hypothetical protein [Leucobacter allii]UOR00380.1 hypothetical protein MUN77_09360 [Leucobacter allii]